MITIANSEDPDEMQHNAAFHQGLHCLQTILHTADKLPRRGCKQIQIHTDSHWNIDFLRF